MATEGSRVGANDSTWDDIAAEVSVLCKLAHPHIIELREFFVEDNTVFLVTSLVQGARTRPLTLLLLIKRLRCDRPGAHTFTVTACNCLQAASCSRR